MYFCTKLNMMKKYIYKTIRQEFDSTCGKYSICILGSHNDDIVISVTNHLRDNLEWASSDRKCQVPIDDLANAMGSIGWRLVTYAKSNDCIVYTFEKTINDETDDEL